MHGETMRGGGSLSGLSPSPPTGLKGMASTLSYHNERMEALNNRLECLLSELLGAYPTATRESALSAEDTCLLGALNRLTNNLDANIDRLTALVERLEAL